MLRPRVIPCLLLKDGGLVKTVRFADPKYVGDPINAVRIYNEKEVDELAVLDIDATRQGREPDYALIRDIAAECRMPVCYGGGVTTVEQIQKIIGLGVEKVAIGAAAASHPQLVSAAAERMGSQSIAVVMDVAKRGLFTKAYEVLTHNATRSTGHHPVDFAQQMQDLGAGELVINSIDEDGQMGGYDLVLAKQIRQSTRLPLTMLGGAGSLEHIAELVGCVDRVGAAAGSLFVFKGKYRAVLINYPNHEQRDALFSALRSDGHEASSPKS